MAVYLDVLATCCGASEQIAVKSMQTSGLDSFRRAIDEINVAIDNCISRGLVIPTQILILSTFDALSYVEFPQLTNSRERFEIWVNARILPHDDVCCEAVDLYAARSAILHRLGGQSRLSEKGQASTITYSHGTASFEALIKIRDAIKSKSGRRFAIVRLEALSDALKKGIAALLKDAESDHKLMARLEEYSRSEQPFRFPA